MTTRTTLAGLSTLLVCTCVTAQGVVHRVLDDPAFVPLHGPRVPRLMSRTPQTVYALPDIVPDGPGFLGSGQANSASARPDESWVRVETRLKVRVASLPSGSKDQAVSVARSCVARLWPRLFDDPVGEPEVDAWLAPGESTWVATWRRRVGGLTTARVTVRVRPWDLRVAGIHYADDSAAADAVRRVSQLTVAEVETTALSAVVRSQEAANDDTVTNLQCADVSPAIGVTDGRPRYEVTVTGRSGLSGAAMTRLIYVDAAKGSLSGGSMAFTPVGGAAGLSPARVCVQSHTLTHTAAGLVFVSDLNIADQPWSSRLSGQLYLRQPDGTISALTCDAGAQVAHCAASAGGRAVAFTRGIWTSVLNLDTGDTALASRRDMPCHQATVSADGQWAIGITGTTGTPDLLPAPLDYTKDSIRLRGRVAADSTEGSPCVSSDGRWLYFGQSDKTGTYLARVAPAEVCRARLMPMEDLGVERLAKLPGWIERITECGGALVVTTVTPSRQRDKDQTHYWRVTDDGKQVSELVIGSPRDEEIGAEVTEVADVTAGPTAADVTFSGRVKTPKGEAGRIYQRAAAGGPVKPLTPAYDQTVPLHRFERTGQTAYDVGRRLVLLERANSPHRP